MVRAYRWAHHRCGRRWGVADAAAGVAAQLNMAGATIGVAVRTAVTWAGPHVPDVLRRHRGRAATTPKGATMDHVQDLIRLVQQLAREAERASRTCG